MSYPFWDTSIGYGVLMSTIAVIHVFISHFAIGGGLYLVVNEHIARRAKDTEHLDYLERLTKFFVLVTLVAGALTGVAIWFIIGLLNPAATQVLIRHYVWGWAIEWCFFVVEIVAAILYFYGWKRVSPRDHLILGWIYFGAAWMSLFIINGIITFMLTPGAWLQTGDFWDGFFNATFWPSLFFRTGMTIMLAGLYAQLVASRQTNSPEAFRTRLVRRNAVWGLFGLAVMAPSLYWYWGAIPEAITAIAQTRLVTPMHALQQAFVYASLIFAGLLLFGLLLPKLQHTVIAAITLLFGLGYFGAFEFFRESVRKPYVVSGFMYGNGIELSRVPELQKHGLLPAMAYRTGDDGADLFRRACRSCHTIDGYKALKPRLDGADRALVAGLVKGTGVMHLEMPPFAGTSTEAYAIAKYLEPQLDNRRLPEITGLQGAKLGERVWQLRCGKCHAKGGERDITETLEGLTAEDVGDILDESGEVDERMPAFSGNGEERTALIEFLATEEEG